MTGGWLEDAGAPAVVATSGGDGEGGGARVVGPGAMRRLDRYPTGGMAVSQDGTRLARVSRTRTRGCDVLVVDARGLLWWARLDGVVDVHDVIWDGEELVVASAGSDELLWIARGGEVVRRWAMPSSGGGSDACHLNCLMWKDGRLLACAFGRFGAHRGWAEPGAAQGQGVVFDVETGEDVLTGLTMPHHPRWIDGRWLVCDSGRGDVVVLEEDGTELQRIHLGRWTRGVAVHGDELYVGLTSHRLLDEVQDPLSAVAVLDRRTYEERRRIAVDAPDVYDLVVVPGPLLAGMEDGMRANPMRIAEERERDALARRGITEVGRLRGATSPLAPDECRVRMTAQLPDEVVAGEVVHVPWRLEHRGPLALLSIAPFPVSVSARWIDRDGRMVGFVDREPFAEPVEPGATASGLLPVSAPEGHDVLELRVSVVQEHVVWFDDVDPANGVRGRVRVVPRAG